MKVYLDGTIMQFPNEALLKPRFTIRRKDEDGAKAISFTGDIEFTGADRDYVYQKLVLDPNATANTVELKFVDDCCNNLEWKFQIKPESLEWCEDNCTLTAAATEFTENSEQYACIKNTLIWDNYAGFQTNQHPKMTYCLEFRPAVLQELMILNAISLNLLFFGLWPIIFIIFIIVAIINAIISVVNSLGGSLTEIDFDGDDSTNFLQEYQNWIDQMNQLLIGCGRKHPSPLVRSYAQNVCGKCGPLAFQSSIFNDPNSKYYNTVYWNAPVKKGQDFTDNTEWRDDNKPLLNGTLYFDQLAETFNADWKIVNNALIFERRDFFINQTPWLDLTTYDPDKIISICYSWANKERFSYGNFQYSKDAIDWVGNEALDRWNDIVEWNSPYSATQKGERLVMSNFGPSRFRNDGVEVDILTKYENAPFFGSIIQQFQNVMIMNNGTAFQPKLMIWDPATGFSNSKVDPTGYPAGFAGVAINQHYNYPLWFNEGYPGNMYDNFWAIENPRNPGFPKNDFKAEIAFDCVSLQAIDVDGTVQTTLGKGTVNEVDVDYNTNTMTITGTI